MFAPKFLFRPIPLAIFVLAGATGVAVIAQIEGSDRGVAPLDSSGSFEVDDIAVDVYGKTAEMARQRAWREAQRLGWRKLWAQTNGGAAPGLSDGALDGIVSGIVVEDEQIGPNRYIARLGVLFDRVRAGQILGVSGSVRRSAPLLVLPVQWSGGTPLSFEARTEWQKAWARFKTVNSSIDYVRPTGKGADPLLLNFGQTGRPGRRWWRVLLDQYGAADVLIPQVQLQHTYPGGPIIARFSARYGPDNRLIQSFALRTANPTGLAKMMDEGVRRIDEIYAIALADGVLRPDTSLIIERPVEEDELDVESAETGEVAGLPAENAPESAAAPTPGAASTTINLQFDTPDVASVSGAESAIRGIPGVKSASTSSLALGGVSVMRVAFDGDADMLKVALAARGYRVSGSGSTLRIRKGQ